MLKETSEIPKNALIRAPYDNFKIYHPDGTLMCFCSRKKANWYLNHGLATLEDEFKIRLTFKPKGYGDPLEILIGRSNCCVISGTTENLTKHHVIPTQYRQHFDMCYKDKNSCDLVVLCRKEHDMYEDIANDFKVRLYNDFIDISEKDVTNAWIEAKSIYNCVNNYYHKLPHDRQIYMTARLEGLIEQWHFTDKELKAKYLKGSKDYNKIIVDKIGTINLIILWKLHFLKYGKPQHLPKWWKPNLIKVINKNNHENKTELIEIELRQEPKLLELIKKYDLYEIASLYL